MDDSYYTGHTSDLSGRFEDHNNGRGSEYTRDRRPLNLVYYERSGSKEDAMAREQEIKGWSRGKKQTLIDSAGWSYGNAIAAYAFVRDCSGRLLLMRHVDRGYWMLPGGGVEPGECLEEGIARELSEEIQHSVRLGKLVGIADRLTNKSQLQIFFEAYIDPPEFFSPTSEASEIALFDPLELPDNIAKRHRERIEVYLSSTEFPFILVQ